MTSRLSRSLAVSAVMLTVLFAVWVSIAEAAPLPSFELIAPDGSVITTRELPITDANWLFIYVRANHHVSEELLRRMNGKEYSGVSQRIVIVVGGVEAGKLRSFLDKYPELAKAFWYADPGKKTVAALKLAGVPIILGVGHQEVAWTLSGIPLDPRTMQSMFTGWVKQ